MTDSFLAASNMFRPSACLLFSFPCKLPTLLFTKTFFGQESLLWLVVYCHLYSYHETASLLSTRSWNGLHCFFSSCMHCFDDCFVNLQRSCCKLTIFAKVVNNLILTFSVEYWVLVDGAQSWGQSVKYLTEREFAFSIYLFQTECRKSVLFSAGIYLSCWRVVRCTLSEAF